jgi:hypothetical protein
MKALREIRSVFFGDLDSRQRAALLSWLGFTGTFGLVRALTYSIKSGKGPFRNLSVGGEHLHHYMWGIGTLAGVGAVAVHGEDSQRRHPAVATSYGAGLALIVDEFALLLDLRDVYWARQGRISVDLGVGGVALAGSYFAALPLLRALRRESEREDDRRDPQRQEQLDQRALPPARAEPTVPGRLLAWGRIDTCSPRGISPFAAP